MKKSPHTPPADRGPRPGAPRVVVLGTAEDARAVAWALGGRLATGYPEAPGVVATWSPGGDGLRTPPSGAGPFRRAAAVRAAAALAERGHAARAAGRFVDVRLAAGPAPAAEAERVQDAAGDGAVVLALGGARGPEWDRMLGEQDLIVLAVGPQVPAALASLALATTAGRCPGVPIHPVAVTGGRRSRPSRRDLAVALDLLAAR